MKHLKTFKIFEAVGYQPGYGTDKAKESGKFENLEPLAQEIDEILSGKGINAKLNLFDSGYLGITIEWPGNKYTVIDQRGHVGLEDQTMPYIELKDGSRESIIEFSPDYHKRGYGRVQMDPEMREEAYNEIKEFFRNV